MLNEYLEKELNESAQKGLLRDLKNAEGPQDAFITLEGKKYLNLCSNNYLGLANDERVKKAAINSIKKNGIGTGASRLVCGNLQEHNLLEKELANFKGTQSAVVFNCGYMANVGIISSLFSRNDIIFSDRLNHASIVDGIILSRAKLKRYPHKDMNALEEMLDETPKIKKKVIITDSVFSMDGDIAPLDKIVYLAKKYNCVVMVDEAHAFGVMGKNARGLSEHFGVEKDIDIQMGTLSKSAGSMGAYCCGKKELISFLINKSRSFIYTTSLPSCVASASRKALEIIKEDSSLLTNLWNNTNFMRKGLIEAGFNIGQSVTPIMPIIIRDSRLAVKFSDMLFDKGIFIQAIRPPTVPENSARLRITVTASHKKKDLDDALKKIIEIAKELKIQTK